MKSGMYSLEYQCLELLIHLAWAHSAVAVDLNQEFYGVSVQIFGETSQVFDPDDFFEEYVEFAASIASEVEILDNFDEIGISKLVDLVGDFANDEFADVFLEMFGLSF